MSETKHCTSCKKNLDVTEFIIENTIFKTCNICKQQKKDKRFQKNTCEICGIRAVFNYQNEVSGVRCKSHIELGMIDIKHKKCIVCKTTIPVFNFEGESIATHCKYCSELGMVDVKSKKCVVCKTKQPAFNFEGESIATHCKDCCEPNMIDIKNKKCVVCKTKQPTFNFEGETTATHCKECSKPDMIDIKHKKCTVCNERAYFGYINKNLTRCTRHKCPLMFRKTEVKCAHENCNEISEYGLNEPSHCFLHKLDNELCLIGQKCIQCLRENELCNRDGYCLTYCKPQLIDSNIKVIRKKKESIALAYIDRYIKSDALPIDDRIIDSSCVKRRPDRLYDCGTFYLIVEIDEHQHSGYHSGCVFDRKTQEVRRMIQIHEALNMGTIPCVFIRFNPDTYKINGKKQTLNMQKRLETLVKWINHCLNNFNTSLFENGNQIFIKYLFYNEYNESNIAFDTINNDDIKNMVVIL